MNNPRASAVGGAARDKGPWVKLIVPIAAAIALALIPWAIQAQNMPPHVLIGAVTLDGATPAAGVMVTAHANGQEIGSALVMEGGLYAIQVSRPPAGTEVTFMVGGAKAAESLSVWTTGAVQRGFNLTATTAIEGCASPGYQSANLPSPTHSAAHGSSPQEPPHVFIGLASTNAALVEAGTEITAWDGARRIGITYSAGGGSYAIQVSRSSGPVTFKINGLTAAQSYPQWAMGQRTRGFQLTASAPANCLQELTGTVDVAAVVDAAGGRIVRVFAFDNETKQWQFYDQEVAEFSNLEQFVPGRPYYILVNESTELMLNGINRTLTCWNGNCWNFVAW